MTRDELARCIDHTLLRPEATRDEVAALCREASARKVAAVCVQSAMLPLDRRMLAGDTAVCAVIGFPSGALDSRVKAVEAALAAAAGASELDMVANLGLASSGDWGGVTADIAAVRSAAPSVLLKVIIESALLADDAIIEACLCAERAGADYVKTSTGFHPSGGATVAAVSLMRRTVGDRLGVKASGGIRDTSAALAMLAAGASRIGTSSTIAILEGMP